MPVPASPTLILAGALYGGAGRSVEPLLAAAVAASLVGDSAWYVAGHRVGAKVLRTLCRISLSPDSCVSGAERSFSRWGTPSLLIARFVPGFTTVATAMAGILKVPFWRFVLADALGAALWAGAAIGIGLVFRDELDHLLQVLDALGKLGVASLTIAVVGFVSYRYWMRRLAAKRIPMDRISVAEMRALIDAGRLGTLVDLRSSRLQASTGRIPGAIMVDAANVETGLSGVARDSEVIFYCACPTEAAAVNVALGLTRRGFKRVRPLTGGLDAWLAAGGDVVR